MKAFVTGGTGHLGSSLVETLLKKNHEVTCLIRETSDLTFLNSLNSQKLFFAIGDITSSESMHETITNTQPDYVFHVAAALTEWHPWEYYYIPNVVGTKNVVEAIEKTSSVKKIIHVSTFGVYGWEDHLNIKEDQPYGKLQNSYTKTKIMNENYLREKYDNGKGLPMTMIRPPIVFGPHDRHTLTRILMNLKHGRMVMPGKGENSSSWAFTQDIADLMLTMAENDSATGEAFNVKTSDLTTKEGIMKLLNLLPLTDVKIRKVPVWVLRILGNLGSAYGVLFRKKTAPLISRYVVRVLANNHACNIEKARDLLGWTPKFSIDEALKITIDWYMNSGTYDAL